MICGVTEVSARNLHAHIQNLMQIPEGETVTGLALEFKVNYLSTFFSLIFIINYFYLGNR